MEKSKVLAWMGGGTEYPANCSDLASVPVAAKATQMPQMNLDRAF